MLFLFFHFFILAPWRGWPGFSCKGQLQGQEELQSEDAELSLPSSSSTRV